MFPLFFVKASLTRNGWRRIFSVRVEQGERETERKKKIEKRETVESEEREKLRESGKERRKTQTDRQKRE